MNSFTQIFRKQLKLILSFALMVFFCQTNAQTYCASGATNPADEDILNVTIGTLNNSSNCATTGGAGSTLNLYSNYTTNVSAPFLTQAVSYTFSVQIGTCGGNYNNWTSIWIDYNKNGVFTDAGEMVYTNPTYTSGPHTETGTITIPATASTGITRMRVVNVETTVQTSSCGTYTWGETEDYNVNIGAPPTYDIVMNSILSPSSWAVGNNTLQVKVGNYGSTTLTGTDVGYSINGGTAVLQSITFPTALVLGQTYNHTFTTAANLPSSGTYLLKVWARNPNGTGPDGNTSNDTITRSICTGISGSFTIDPSGSGSTNYASFTAAAAALNSCGVSGPCYFTVAAGTYTEKITLGAINGTSATNTITFDGVDSTTRTITFNHTLALPDNAVINLMGASYVTIKNLRIVNTGATYGAGISIQNGSNYNTITNCRVNITATSGSTNAYGIGVCGTTISTTSLGGNNMISFNKVVGGYAGIALYGTSSSVFANGNSVIGNNISGSYLYGIYDYYQNLNTVTDNRILLSSSTNTYGLYSYYCQNNKIERNIIVAAYMGMYIYNNNNLGTTRMTCHNNIINMNGPYNYSTNYGLYALYNVNGDFYHNTVYSAPTVASGYCAYVGYGSGCNFKNNIFHSSNAAMYAVYCPSITFTSFDYNIYYSPGTSLVYWQAAYGTLAALKTGAPLFHQKSIFKIANFVSLSNKAEDFHLASTSAADVAEFATALTLDVDSEARCALAPSIGADDSKFGAGTLVANFATPDSTFINSPTAYANYLSLNTPSYKEWYVDGILVSTSHDLLYTFGATGSYQVKLKIIGCFEMDSITKTVVVYNLTQKPIANFISDLNVIPTNGNVSFKDLSTKGPAFWNWSVNPTVGVTFINGTTANSQNPVMRFASAGLYTICLYDSNAIGKGNAICKTGYILVQATTNMCQAPFTTKVSSGNIYDDGGQTGNYTANKLCKFLIDPCASTVNLTFTEFSLSTGSYFRAYNGIDNTATPLFTGLGFTGITMPPSLTASSGKMFIEFETSVAVNKGFEATWTSVAGTFPAPIGSISAPDTTDDCGSLSTYTFVSSQAGFNRDQADYSWYFGNSSAPQFSSQGAYSVQYGFTSAGVYPIRLVVNGCGGNSTFFDTVRVISITTPPTIAFSTSAVRATITDEITLTDLSKYGTTSRQWTITGPGTVTAISGTTTSSVYIFKLGTPGVYNVKLVGTNCKGTDSLTKTGHITIFNYCTPIVTNLNQDFSIQTVTFGRIDTVINGEVKGFDYTNTIPALGTVGYRDNTNKIKSYSFGTKAVEGIADIGGTYSFSVTRPTALNTANTNVWIDYNQDGSFQSSELVASSGVVAGRTYTGTITIPLNATIGITRMRVGTAVGLLSNAPCGANMYGDFNDYRIKITPDLTKPTITFSGNDTIFVEVGRVFTDPGFTVTDNITNPCPYNVTGITSGSQITSHPFTSSYVVTATDAAGNVSVRTRVVKSSPDVTKPVITLTGSSPKTVEVGTTYNDSGATATDFYFGSLTSSIVTNNAVNAAVTGTYTVTYNVTDAAGNAATTVTRTVIVKDTQKPVITVSGANPLTVEVYSTFTAPTAVVNDNYCTGLTYTVTGSVNTNVIGTYTLTYNAVDCEGNNAVPIVLTVLVKDTKAPSLLFILGDTVTIDVNTMTTVPEPGYVLNDNYYNIGALTLNVNYANVKLNIVGNYPVRYYVNDPAGNMDSSKVRVYKIVDRIAPVITLTGDGFINWKRWTPYVDPGTIVSDNYYTGLTATVDFSQVNVYLDGTYTVRCNITDPSGNKAIEVLRYVRVYTAPSGINTNTNNAMISVYPNPNNGIVNVDLNNTEATYANIVIFDANGKMVYSNNIINMTQNKVQIDLSNEASGMYFIKVITNNATSSKSFSIQK